MEGRGISIPDEFPVINLYSSIMPLPGSKSWIRMTPFYNNLLNDARQGLCPFIFAVMSRPGEEFSPDGFYKVGVICQLELDEKDDSIVILSGKYRAQVLKYKRSGENNNGYFIAKVSPFQDKEEELFETSTNQYMINPKYEEMLRSILLKIKRYIKGLISELSNAEDHENDANILQLQDVLDDFENYRLDSKAGLDHMVWSTLDSIPDIKPQEKQEMLGLRTTAHRLRKVTELLLKNIVIVKGSNRIEKDILDNMEEDDIESSPRSGPRSKMSTKSDDNASFTKGAHPELVEKYKKFLEIKDHMNEDAIKSIMESFKRLKAFGQSNSERAEWAMFMNHIDFMIDLPWNKESDQEKNISRVEEVLNNDHFGLDFVKIHILRYLAGKLLNPKGRGANLCFVGPPGVGKTSLANSIAGALNRKLVRLSLGGLRDEAEIRGHRKTYIGALAGQIMQEMKRSGMKNPVFVLDEIDKLANDFRGDPSAALLEVLDPEQNHSFRDHYLDAPFDLSQVLFIATANEISTIRPALFDRLEPVFIPGYTRYEKVQIAKKFLIPRVISQFNLSEHKIDFKWPDNNPDEIIYDIIKGYTKEPGVRNLERHLATLGRDLGKEYLRNTENFINPEIDKDRLVKVFGQPRYTEDRANKTRVGEIIGLAWTQFGGDILYIQSAMLPEFKGKELSQTGSLGKVMQESGKLAMSLIRRKLEEENKKDHLKEKSIHIHVPEGATEKDGPSAGVTIFCSLYSTAFRKIARPYVAMTGEITLTGMVTAVGGIKEKVIAAESAGIKEVLLPASNRRDLDEVPQSAKDNLKFHFIDNVDQALKIVFDESLPAV